MGEQTISIGGQRIAFLASVGSGRAVIFVHGNSSSARTWEPMLTGPFGQRFRCLALDLPGHGRSAPAEDHSVYSLPGYAGMLAGFAQAAGAADAVIVGWSLGGHIALEAAPSLPAAAGLVVFGTPPVSSAAQMGEAFLPNPAMNVGFTAAVSADEAQTYAASFTAPGSPVPRCVHYRHPADRRRGPVRAVRQHRRGQFADEVAIAQTIGRPLTILHGAGEQLVNLQYLRQLAILTLWRGEVQVIPGTGYSPHQEAPPPSPPCSSNSSPTSRRGEPRDAQLAARATQDTKDFQVRYALRAGVEGAIRQAWPSPAYGTPASAACPILSDA